MRGLGVDKFPTREPGSQGYSDSIGANSARGLAHPSPVKHIHELTLLQSSPRKNGKLKFQTTWHIYCDTYHTQNQWSTGNRMIYVDEIKGLRGFEEKHSGNQRHGKESPISLHASKLLSATSC